MSHLQPDPASRVVPAQANFLTIYNPSLGDTDETERDQIVFWASREDLDFSDWKSSNKDQGHNSNVQDDTRTKEKTEDEQYNERLRQIGLARGMVEFVKNFSNNKPVDTVETEKSRIILHELETGWWILASVDLTKLPAPVTATAQQKAVSKQSRVTQSNESISKWEYSAREVSPCSVLLAQLLKAHRVFLLHHASSLWDIHHKLGRPSFCSLLSRYWERFFRNWDVLLHGNPAIEVYGACTKLAGGGELGIGVGEEDWGSGEREVLEAFVARTEGLVDMVVGRYGDAPKKGKGNDANEEQMVDKSLWLGVGEDPGPADGVIFSGTGILTRKCLATVSQWMEAIFKHGEEAYGVGENPSARPRAKRKARQPSKTTRQASGNFESANKKDNSMQAEQQESPRYLSPRGRAPDLRRKAMENNASPPGIPAPLVGQVERSLDEALMRVANRSSSRSPKSSPKQEKSEEDAMQSGSSKQATDDPGSLGSSWFDADKMTKVFTLGYGSSWTLSPKGLPDQEQKNKVQQTTDSKSQNDNPKESKRQTEDRPKLVRKVSKPAEERLQELDPTPAVSDDEEQKPFVQHLERAAGRFLIGLAGDLESADVDDDRDQTKDDSRRQTKAQRIYLRTLTMEITRPPRRPSLVSAGRTVSQDSYSSDRSRGSNGSSGPKTSAAASIDGPARASSYSEKIQVAVYVHQPFIFIFMFELHTPSLTMTGFYRNIHHQLGPLQGLLLKRTDPERVAERIKDVIVSMDDKTTASILAKTATAGNMICDLVYDPSKLTIRTSIPNIPIPVSQSLYDGNYVGKTTTVSGSWYTLGIPISSTDSSSAARVLPKADQATKDRAAEQWTRLDALNVHGQILNSWLATRPQSTTSKSSLGSGSSMTAEIERTVKTNRGWWVLWMTVAAQPRKSTASSSSSTSTTTGYSPCRPKEAFLVRKSTDAASAVGRITQRNGSSGRWLLREQTRDTNRGSSGNAGDGNIAGAKSISEGVGIDAKRWIEGLLHLSQ